MNIEDIRKCAVFAGDEEIVELCDVVNELKQAVVDLMAGGQERGGPIYALTWYEGVSRAERVLKALKPKKKRTTK